MKPQTRKHQKMTSLSLFLIATAAAVAALVLLHSVSADAARSSLCPDRFMVHLPAPFSNICVDKYEFAVEYFNSSLQQWKIHPFNYPLDSLIAKSIPFRAISARHPRVVAATGGRPQAYLSMVAASAAARAAGKRLCSSEEWLFACRGPSNRTWPHSKNTYEPNRCNDVQKSPILRLFGPKATFNFTEMNDPRCDLLPDSLEAAGSRPGCVNDETGTIDMAGSLDEWTSTIQSNGHGIFRGGYFVEATINGPGCLDVTTAHAVKYHDYSLGSRACVTV